MQGCRDVIICGVVTGGGIILLGRGTVEIQLRLTKGKEIAIPQGYRNVATAPLSMDAVATA